MVLRRDNYHQLVYSYFVCVFFGGGLWGRGLVFDHFSAFFSRNPSGVRLLCEECVMWLSRTIVVQCEHRPPPAALLHHCCCCCCCRGISSLACRRWLGAVEHRHLLSRDSLLALSSLLSFSLSISTHTYTHSFSLSLAPLHTLTLSLSVPPPSLHAAVTISARYEC